MNTSHAVSAPDPRALLERLRIEHTSLKERVSTLERHHSLTPQEQVECARLKKQKLAAKDEIFRLEHDLMRS